MVFMVKEDCWKEYVMAHPGIYLVSLEVQKAGKRLKMKSPGWPNEEGGTGIYLVKVTLAGTTHFPGI